jgi:hypothetical protein
VPAWAATEDRDMGSRGSASPAVRRYQTSNEAVRSPRRFGTPAKNRQIWRVA